MTIAQKQKVYVRRRAEFHCEYCKRSEDILATNFEVDHIIPVAMGGSDDNDNLACACRDCNARKSNKITCIDPETNSDKTLFHPRQQSWKDHFEWSEDGSVIIGKSPTGRATIDCLQMNDSRLCQARIGWRKLGWTPPQD